MTVLRSVIVVVSVVRFTSAWLCVWDSVIVSVVVVTVVKLQVHRPDVSDRTSIGVIVNSLLVI